MKPLAVLLATVTLIFASTRPAVADFVVYSDFGPGQTYGTGYYSISGGGSDPGPVPGYGFALAQSFVPTSNFLFTSVELALTDIVGTNAITVSLMSDAGGHPGTILESFSVTGLTRYPGSVLETLVSTTNTPLNAGTTYWIAAMPVSLDTAAGWMINSTGATGRSRTVNDYVTWVALAEDSAAFEVTGVQVTSVPEPSSLTLLSIGAAALAAWRWGRRPGHVQG
jgi:hypothetical protein